MFLFLKQRWNIVKFSPTNATPYSLHLCNIAKKKKSYIPSGDMFKALMSFFFSRSKFSNTTTMQIVFYFSKSIINLSLLKRSTKYLRKKKLNCMYGKHVHFAHFSFVTKYFARLSTWRNNDIQLHFIGTLQSLVLIFPTGIWSKHSRHHKQ